MLSELKAGRSLTSVHVRDPETNDALCKSARLRQRLPYRRRACDPELAKSSATAYRHRRRWRGVFESTGARMGRIRLANADGSIAEISGNGTRCVAAWMPSADLRSGDVITLETDAGPRACTIVTRAAGFSNRCRHGVPQVAQAQVTWG